ncbi:MAG: histidine phosphatase family protein [Clostridia bacterium]|nr:histidine phosphatase family protein [Clostridia bacterium]
MHIYIIRHGETYGNLNGDGFTETDLTPNGEEQALRLGDRFKDMDVDKIYVSPLIRAVKTAKEIHKFHEDSPVIIDSLLLEKGTDAEYCGLPDESLLEYLPSARILKREPLGEEDDKKAYSRACKFIEKTKSENDFDSKICVVAHGTFNSYLVLAALGFPVKESFNFSHLNTGVSLVCYIEEKGVIKTKLKYLNDTSHLGLRQE